MHLALAIAPIHSRFETTAAIKISVASDSFRKVPAAPRTAIGCGLGAAPGRPNTLSQAFVFWSRWPLAAQWAITGGLLLGALWSLLLWDLQQHERDERRHAQSGLESMADIGAQALQSTVRAADLILLDLREEWLSRPTSFADTVRRRQVQARLEFEFDIVAIDENGRLRYSSFNPQAAGLDLSDTASFKTHRDSAADVFLASPPIRARLAGRTLIYFTRPMHTPAGQFAGFMGFAVAPEYLSRLYRGLDLGKDGALSVVRDDGAIVLRLSQPQSPHAGSGAPTVSQLRPGLPDNGLARLRSSVDQVERTYAWRKLDGYPLTLFVGQPDGTLYQRIADHRRYYLAGSAVGSLLLLLALCLLLLSTRRRTQAEKIRMRASRLLSEHMAHSNAELRASQQALRALSSHQMAVKEAERRHIAREIHDELGQRLTVLRMDMSMLPRAVQADPAGLLPAQVAALKRGIDDILAIVRDIAGKLRPATLDIGLAEAAEGLLAEFQASLGIPCELDNQLPPGLTLDETRATGIFRILQESLTNAARHARASRIDVTLALRGNWLHLRVRDNGRGFALSPNAAASFGLSGMRERAAALGGELHIDSRPDHGATVRARIPRHGLLQPSSMIPLLDHASLTTGL